MNLFLQEPHCVTTIDAKQIDAIRRQEGTVMEAKTTVGNTWTSPELALGDRDLI